MINIRNRDSFGHNKCRSLQFYSSNYAVILCSDSTSTISLYYFEIFKQFYTQTEARPEIQIQALGMPTMAMIAIPNSMSTTVIDI